MKRNTVLFNGISLLIAVVFTLGVAACGTLLYPERRGQTGGRIDAGVAVMDGLGLILFIVPGAIAFVVDFSTGAIYLPSGSSRLDLDPPDIEQAQVIRTDDTSLDLAEIERLVEDCIGQEIDLRSAETKVARLSAGHRMVLDSISEVLTADQLAAVAGEDEPGRG